MTTPAQIDPLRATIGAFFEVYNRLGYGFLETHYAAALERELRRAGLRVAREYATKVWFKDEPIGTQRLDLVVNEALVVEIKAMPAMPAHAWQQLRSYLRATGLRTGVLLHFGPRPRFYKMLNDDARLRRDRTA